MEYVIYMIGALCCAVGGATLTLWIVDQIEKGGRK